MTSVKRILVLGDAGMAGDWPPLAAVTVGLHQAGHAVQCFGDPAIARHFALAGIAVEVIPAENTLGAFTARWRATGASGPRPEPVWAEACWPSVRSLVRDFRPELVLSQLYTMELARRTKAACGLCWCCINPAYYFGPDSLRPFEADFAESWQPKKDLRQGIGEADLVLHATDALFDPPPPSFPRHHHHVGPLLWEPASEAPPYLDVPGAPWVLVTVSSAPQPEEMTLAQTALQTLAAYPVRVVITLTAGHPRDELGASLPMSRLSGSYPMRRCSNAAVSWSATRGMGSSPKPSTTACPWCWCPGIGISLVWPPVRPPSGWRK